MIHFCKEYDYSSLVPTKAGKNKDISLPINKLLSMRHVRFTQLKIGRWSEFTRPPSFRIYKANGNFDFIRRGIYLNHGKKRIYEIIDLKIAFMIQSISRHD